jgi:hypothetical protein
MSGVPKRTMAVHSFVYFCEAACRFGMMIITTELLWFRGPSKCGSKENFAQIRPLKLSARCDSILRVTNTACLAPVLLFSHLGVRLLFALSHRLRHAPDLDVIT